ncbi:MAG: PAS domain S-box protein [bacterium]|nr:PAS domain S-box protein [bacterium]
MSLLLLATGPLLLFSYQSFERTVESQRNFVGRGMAAQAQSLVGQLAARINQFALETSRLADSPYFNSLYVQPSLPLGPKDQQREADWEKSGGNSQWADQIFDHPVSRNLREYVAIHDQQIASIYLTDRQGRLLAASARVPHFLYNDQVWWRETTAKGQGETVYSDRSNQKNVDDQGIGLSVPIWRQGHLMGTLLVVLDRGFLAQILNQIPKASQSERAILSSLTGKLFSPSASFEQQMDHWTGPLDLWGLSGEWTRQSFGGEIFMVAHAHFPIEFVTLKEGQAQRAQWVLLIGLQESLALDNLFQLRGLYWSLLVFQVGLSVLLALWLSRYLFKPVNQLKEAMEDLAQGDQPRPIPVHGKDEFALLAQGFNKMTERIQQATDRLEAEVDRRTEALRTTNRHLLNEIEAHRAAEDQLTDQRNLAQEYLNIAEVMIVSLDLKGRIRMINRSGTKILGWTEKELLGRSWLEHCVPKSAVEQVSNIFEKLLKNQYQKRTYAENKIVRSDGTERLISWHNSVLFDSSGQPRMILASGQDITDQRRTTEALQYSEEQLRTLLQASMDAILTFNEQGRLVFWNRGAELLFGYTAEEMIGRSIEEALPPNRSVNDLEALKTAAQRRSLQGLRQVDEVLGRRKEGSDFPGELSLASWEMRGHRFYSGILRDISSRRQAEESQRRLRTAIDQVDDMVFITDPQGKLLYQNPAFSLDPQVFPQALFVSGKLACEEQSEPIYQEICQSLSDFADWRGELSRPDPERGFVYYEATISPVRAPEGGLASIVFICADVTQDRLVQAQLVQSQKMEALGTLSGGVAHEINNPIGYVNSNLNSLAEYLTAYHRMLAFYAELEEQVELSPSLRERLEALKEELELPYILQDSPQLLQDTIEGTERVKAIVRNLKEFAHTDQDQMTPTDLNESLRKAVQLAWNELKYKCEVIEAFHPLPLVECYPQQINQVFLNLIINAAQAIETQGKITLTTESSGGEVRIRVADTGAGIKPEHLPKLFEPFFTTKDVGRGTGLGLSVTYNIVKGHSGKIEVKSQLGQGTEFTLQLPISQADRSTREENP